MSAEQSAAVPSNVNGKAPAHPHHNPDHPLVEVQPPRLSDLQPKYASVIQHDDSSPEAHGWYASFSMSNPERKKKNPLLSS